MNSIEEAKQHLIASFNAENSAANKSEHENAKTIALIAIAEQLRIGNLIALANSGEVFNSAARAYQELESPEFDGVGILSRNIGSLRPDIAEALGIKKETK